MISIHCAFGTSSQYSLKEKISPAPAFIISHVSGFPLYWSIIVCLACSALLFAPLTFWFQLKEYQKFILELENIQFASVSLHLLFEYYRLSHKH